MHKWFTKYRPIKLAVLLALYFLLFILLINPFRDYRGIAENHLPRVIIASLIVLFLVFAVYFVFQKKALLLIRLLAIPIMFFISLYFIFSSASVINLNDILIMSAATSIVPVFFELIFSDKKGSINTNLTAGVSETKDYVLLNGTNQLDTLRVLSKNIIVIEANDNYVNVSYLEENELKKKMLRATLKNIAIQLEHELDFEKIHRSVIINKNYLKSITGKSQQKKVILDYLQKEYPISRHFDLDRISKS
ncbi:MAG: hypothetical protein ACI8ZM_000044 [Crocinitomix sp.]|jgi:hypothetical protein